MQDFSDALSPVKLYLISLEVEYNQWLSYCVVLELPAVVFCLFSLTIC